MLYIRARPLVKAGAAILAALIAVQPLSAWALTAVRVPATAGTSVPLGAGGAGALSSPAGSASIGGPAPLAIGASLPRSIIPRAQTPAMPAAAVTPGAQRDRARAAAVPRLAAPRITGRGPAASRETSDREPASTSERKADPVSEVIDTLESFLFDKPSGPQETESGSSASLETDAADQRRVFDLDGRPDVSSEAPPVAAGAELEGRALSKAKELGGLIKSVTRSLGKKARSKEEHEAVRRGTEKLFKELDGLAERDGERALAAVQELAGRTDPKTLARWVRHIPAEWYESSGMTPEKVEVTAARIRRLILAMKPENAGYRASAAVGLFHHVVATLQKRTFRALAAEGDWDKPAEALHADAVFLRKQGAAFLELFGRLSSVKSLQDLDRKAMRRIVGNLNDLGFFYLKLAQSVSNTGMAFSAEALEELRVIQDQVPEMPPETVLQVIREEFGREAHELFVDFDAAKPIASGSIAQIYKAKVRTWYGRLKPVIIKVQRPGLAATLEWNRDTNRTLLKLADIFGTPQVKPLLELFASQVTGLEDAFELEMDFLNEARDMGALRRLFIFHRRIRVPKAVFSRTTRRVLTMSVVPGENLEDLVGKLEADAEAELAAAPAPSASGDPALDEDTESYKSRLSLISTLEDALLYQLLVVRYMHADMHPGNVLARMSGRISLIDWAQCFDTRGLVLRPLRAFYHLALGHPKSLARAMLRMGRLPGKKPRALEEKAAEIFAKHKVEDLRLMDILRKRREYSDDQLERAMAASAELLKTALLEMGFRMSPKYLQFLRSVLPVVGSLAVLGAKVPGGTHGKMLAKKLLVGFPLGILAYLTARVIGFPGTVLDRIRLGLQKRRAARREPAPETHSIPRREPELGK